MNRTLQMRRLSWGGLGILFCAACAPAALVDVTPPSGVVDPATVATPSGATQLYNLAISQLAMTMDGNPVGTGHVEMTGVLTDELMWGGSAFVAGLDERTVADMSTRYGSNHTTRNFARQAREALDRYSPAAPPAFRGRMYSVEGYTVLFFAESFCSGVPLSTVPLVGPPTTSAGLSTPDLFTYAAALFDSAITLSADSARLLNLARVGKGRALLGLGKFTDASTAVQAVPMSFIYTADYPVTVNSPNIIGNNPRLFQVVDGEGGNGLLWSTDPRTAVTTTPTLSGGMKVTAKYSLTSTGTLDPTTTIPNASIRVADGLEAQLIIAEADLAAGGTNWLTILNILRSTCVGSAACAPIPASVNLPLPLAAGSLPPLADPGTPNARLDLLIKERAMWLFLTGHRQGDLRRLAHVYQRDPATLWPTGTYTAPRFPPLVAGTIRANGIPYGSAVVFPTSETNNPVYSGCFDLNP